MYEVIINFANSYEQKNREGGTCEPASRRELDVYLYIDLNLAIGLIQDINWRLKPHLLTLLQWEQCITLPHCHHYFIIFILLYIT